MWAYEQSTGRLFAPDGSLAGTGYSGAGAYKNDPTAQELKNLGPIPCGLYAIGEPVNTVTHGPYVLPLAPDPANEMFGRDGFLLHGDSVISPGAASEGCIVMDRVVRELVGNSPDKQLRVLTGGYEAT